jgi:hypothetical protein
VHAPLHAVHLVAIAGAAVLTPARVVAVKPSLV